MTKQLIALAIAAAFGVAHAADVKPAAEPADNKHVKKVKHAPATTPEVHSADAAKAVEPVKK